MAQLTSIAYYPGSTRLHDLDTRFKLALMVLISVSTLHASAFALAALSLVFIWLFGLLPIHLADLVRELRLFFLLLAFIFSARMLSTPGNHLWVVGGITITIEGIQEGALVCWRLLLVVLMGVIFVSTTRISRIKEAVAWYLAPVPMIPEKKIATMMGLLVRFIPVIFQKTREVSQAQQARCSENIKNPITRFRRLAFPLVQRIFQDAENIADAMAARCYAETAVRKPAKTQRQDWLIFGLGIFCCLTVSFL